MTQQGSFQKVRVRYAPSPTGYLHVGGARTALYNFLYARKNHGDFILRVEDTDEARSSMESLRMVIDDMQWLGLTWEEGPNPKTLEDIGDFGPYKQSARQKIYQAVAQELLQKGLAYYCFLTDAEIEQQKAAVTAEGGQHHLQSPYENWSLAQAQEKLKAGDKAVVRFKTKNLKKDYVLHDLIRGEVRFPSDMVGDFVLLRSDGMPVYNFCCVVDDHLMQISHVLRAEEHLSNTLRQLMIYEAMSWVTPQFGHVSLVLDDDRQKLSKRKGATSCNQFRDEGYLPEAILNFIALLGWSHPEEKEVLSLKEMMDSFSTDRLHSSGAVFDRVKLKWVNAQHLRAKNETDLWQLVEPFLVKNQVAFFSSPQWQNQALRIFKPYMETLVDAVELFKTLDDKHFQIQAESKEVYDWPSSPAVLKAWKDVLEASVDSEITEEGFLKLQDEVKTKSGTKGKFLFMPMRVAVIGKPHGTELKTIIPLMTKKALVNRAEIALAKVNGQWN
ncbi:MAG: glutamate--tRNA ligase [Bdellovibrionaceae bacterium]|nr:glutamate--tRNA ligase [Pseudobdellovibrionaceae bacterium]NUM58011.1 glutamate--tRNA ligase [Pseudobdellovibrionaceae bacterium]